MEDEVQKVESTVALEETAQVAPEVSSIEVQKPISDQQITTAPTENVPEGEIDLRNAAVPVEFDEAAAAHIFDDDEGDAVPEPSVKSDVKSRGSKSDALERTVSLTAEHILEEAEKIEIVEGKETIIEDIQGDRRVTNPDEDLFVETKEEVEIRGLSELDGQEVTSMISVLTNLTPSKANVTSQEKVADEQAEPEETQDTTARRKSKAKATKADFQRRQSKRLSLFGQKLLDNIGPSGRRSILRFSVVGDKALLTKKPQDFTILDSDTSLELEPYKDSKQNLGEGEEEEGEAEGQGEHPEHVFIFNDDSDSSTESSDESGEKYVTDEFDRAPFYEAYDRLSLEQKTLKIKNNFLQKKMVEYFKKRKMEHVLREDPGQPSDTVRKYERKLDTLFELLQKQECENVRVKEEIQDLKKQREEKEEIVKLAFKKMVAKERETGYGLISTKTGKPLNDKYVDHLIHRQSSAMNQIQVLRLKYILLRDRYNEKDNRLKALDNIGEDLHLIDYEQLKVENRGYADKLEERDVELSRLRVKCRNTIQIMAHVREKSAALEADIQDLKDDYEDITQECIMSRSYLNDYKFQRDKVRNQTQKLREESGLLAKPELLLDMEKSMEEYDRVNTELNALIKDYNLKAKQLRRLRKNIRIANENPTRFKKFADLPKFKLPKLEKNSRDKQSKFDLSGKRILNKQVSPKKVSPDSPESPEKSDPKLDSK